MNMNWMSAQNIFLFFFLQGMFYYPLFLWYFDRIYIGSTRTYLVKEGMTCRGFIYSRHLSECEYQILWSRYPWPSLITRHIDSDTESGMCIETGNYTFSCELRDRNCVLFNSIRIIEKVFSWNETLNWIRNEKWTHQNYQCVFKFQICIIYFFIAVDITAEQPEGYRFENQSTYLKCVMLLKVFFSESLLMMCIDL